MGYSRRCGWRSEIEDRTPGHGVRPISHPLSPVCCSFSAGVLGSIPPQRFDRLDARCAPSGVCGREASIPPRTARSFAGCSRRTRQRLGTGMRYGIHDKMFRCKRGTSHAAARPRDDRSRDRHPTVLPPCRPASRTSPGGALRCPWTDLPAPPPDPPATPAPLGRPDPPDGRSWRSQRWPT